MKYILLLFISTSFACQHVHSKGGDVKVKGGYLCVKGKKNANFIF